jgi:hypothetical protein
VHDVPALNRDDVSDVSERQSGINCSPFGAGAITKPRVNQQRLRVHAEDHFCHPATAWQPIDSNARV